MRKDNIIKCNILIVSFQCLKFLIQMFINLFINISLSDTPGKAGTPVVEDVDSDSVTLSWTKPTDDGGNKVAGYVVEVREKGTNKWKPLNEKVPCKDTKFTGKMICNAFSCYLAKILNSLVR